MSSILVTDFDGAVTQRDFYQIALERLTPPGTAAIWDQYHEGRLSHFEALRQIFLRIRADRQAIEDALREMVPDPQLGAAVERLRTAGWEVVAASAGCTWYIDLILDSLQVSIPVHGNPGRMEDGGGLVMELPRESPYFSPSTGIDKAALVRDMLRSHDRVAFAGDGPPDLAPALLVEGGLRFARGWLARELERRRLPFRPFEVWSGIAAALA